MAIIGGAGNPVGGSFTGPAEALEVLGDHAYAYSGQIGLTNAGYSTFLDFTSGNFATKAELQININTYTTDDCEFVVKMNGAIIQGWHIQGSEFTMRDTPVILFIPAYTQVEVTGKNISSGSSRNATASIVGRIYRTRD